MTYTPLILLQTTVLIFATSAIAKEHYRNHREIIRKIDKIQEDIEYIKSRK
jgi:hypothetical protein